MKYLLKITSIIFFMAMNSFAQEKVNDFTEITYEARTRGSEHVIKVTQNSVYFKNNQETKEVPLSKVNRDKLVQMLSDLSLKSINSLKAPSNKRATDRVLHANLAVKTGGASYKSSTFDEGYPPNELKKIVKLLFSLNKAE
ncbi:hypothetical protein [uncultured Tenacibaculum sp.]|uniref:hypothetical protein n=1 Tax=uncultured Tenacibaculum sp. TaxID=174713 RepID=UPI002603FC2C|nr:hypothetical protein [uncultured Tenacibaculum sp.]